MNAPATQNITVNYAMNGNASSGSDYILSGNPGQTVIQAGQSSATVILDAVASNVKSKPKTATMTLRPGSGYSFGSNATSGGGKKGKKAKGPTAPSATVTITN
jgi:hypothetical protein